MINFSCEVAGRYRLRTYLKDGSLTKDTGWFDNLILDQGLDQIGQTSNYNYAFNEPNLFVWASVGTGTTAPATTDTQLEAYLANTSKRGDYSSTTWVTGAKPYWKVTATYRFAEGVAAGNLTEVGVGEKLATNIGTNLFSRALILDGGGSPTTLVVTSTEILDLTYEFRVYPDTTERYQDIVINGNTYSFTWNLWKPTTTPRITHAYINGSGDFNSCIYSPSPTLGTAGTAYRLKPTSAGYTSGTYMRTYTGTYARGVLPTTIPYLTILSNHMQQVASISPSIPLTAIQYFSITINVSWARFTP